MTAFKRTPVFVTLVLPAVPVAAAARPNIVLILYDALGYADVGYNRASDIETPAPEHFYLLRSPRRQAGVPVLANGATLGGL